MLGSCTLVRLPTGVSPGVLALLLGLCFKVLNISKLAQLLSGSIWGPGFVCCALVVALSACGSGPDDEEAGAAKSANTDRRAPNVLFVVADTLRTDHLSAYGYAWPTSPNLDQLAGRGVTFLQCTAQASWTMPSMISLMTGQPVFSTLYRIPDGFPVLAERFAEAGYRTGAFVGNSLLADEAGFARGIEQWAVRQRKRNKWKAEDIRSKAVDFFDAAEADDRPWFLWVHTMDTHTPYEPPSVPWTRQPTDVFDESQQALIRQVLDEASTEMRPALAAQIPELAESVDLYDGEVAVVDEFLGQLLQELDARSWTDNTYVVFVADHGETLFERREITSRTQQMVAWKERNGLTLHLEDLLKKEHDGTVYQELVRTPFVLAGPGIRGPLREPALVANIDVGPTLLGLCGLPSSLGAGRDLSAALLTGSPVASAVWATTSCQQALGALLPDGRKLVLPLLDVEHGFDREPRVYDLRLDPGEKNPFPVGDDPELQRVLEQLRKAQEAGPFSPFSGSEADPETLERLRELGYVR